MIAYMFKKASEAINMKHLFFSHKCGPEWKVIEYIVIYTVAVNTGSLRETKS